MKTEITILQLNDVHAYLKIHPELFFEAADVTIRNCGGYPRISSLVKRIREQQRNVLLFDSGDTFHGTYPVIDTRGELLISVLNDLHFTAMTAHWDFAYGPKRLKELSSMLNYPILACNVFDKETSQLEYPPFKTIQCDGITIGIIGLACNIVDKTMPASFSEGLLFTDGSAELPGCIQQLKDQNADIIVLLSHNGFPQDAALVSQITGIDLVLSGHTHNRLYSPTKVKNTLIIQSGSHGSFLGKIKLKISDKKINHYEHELLEIEERIQPDAILLNKIDKSLSEYGFLNENVGKTATLLHRGFSIESNMDNFLLESIRESVPADLYFSNGWRYGVPVPPGFIKLEDLYNIVPMDPVISIVDLSGAEISELIENNLEHTYSSNPLRQMGGYVKRALGIKVYYKPENPQGTRIQSVFVKSRKLDPDCIYKAAFITEQGVPKGYGLRRTETDLHAVQAMKLYVMKHKIITTEMLGSFIPV